MKISVMQEQNMRFGRGESRLIFCGKGVCGDLIECDLPTLVEGVCNLGEWKVYFSDDCEKPCWAVGAKVILCGEGAVIYPFCIGEKTKLAVWEFQGVLCHKVNAFSNGCVVECDGGEFVFGGVVENCLCNSWDGCDFLFLQGGGVLEILQWNGEKYQSATVPCGKISQSGVDIFLEFQSQTSCGCVLQSRMSMQKLGENFTDWVYESFKLKMGGNYKKETFHGYFLEICQLARFLHPAAKKKILAEVLSSELLQNCDGVLEYLGEFCGMICDVYGVIALYQKSENVFCARKFEMEISAVGSGRLVVENITESQYFSLPTFMPKAVGKVFLW